MEKKSPEVLTDQKRDKECVSRLKSQRVCCFDNKSTCFTYH